MINYINRYSVLILFVCITFFGLLLGYLGENDWLRTFWGILDVSFAVALGILAFMGYWEYIKSEDEIKIYFKVDNKRVDTHLSFLRKDCNRGEILGILGMMQLKTKKRFSFDSKDLFTLLKEVQEVQKGDKDFFEIEMSIEEFEQFIIYEVLE